MGKFQVVATVRSRLRAASGSMPPSIEDGCSQLFRSCTKAARKMLELFGNIDRTGNVTKSSFTDFQGCSIATMILLVAGILERDLCYEARTSFGLACLRKMAGDHLAASDGVHFMEALKTIADEAADKLRRTIIIAGKTPAPVQISDTLFTPQATILSEHWDATVSLSQPLVTPTEDAFSTAQAANLDYRAWTTSERDYSDPFSLLQYDHEAFLIELTDLETRGISGS